MNLQKIDIIRTGTKKQTKLQENVKKEGQNDSGGGGGYLFHYNPKTKIPDLRHDIIGRGMTHGERSV